jgi:YD repeat-containing protein
VTIEQIGAPPAPDARSAILTLTGRSSSKIENRTQVLYSAPDSGGIARMTGLRDRNGNRIQFKYNPRQLVEVVDTLGRSILIITMLKTD